MLILSIIIINFTIQQLVNKNEQIIRDIPTWLLKTGQFFKKMFFSQRISFFNRKLFSMNPNQSLLQISVSRRKYVIFLYSRLTFEIVVSESKIIKGLISTHFSYRRQEDNNYRLKEAISLCVSVGDMSRQSVRGRVLSPLPASRYDGRSTIAFGRKWRTIKRFFYPKDSWKPLVEKFKR